MSRENMCPHFSYNKIKYIIIVEYYTVIYYNHSVLSASLNIHTRKPGDCRYWRIWRSDINSKIIWMFSWFSHIYPWFQVEYFSTHIISHPRCLSSTSLILSCSVSPHCFLHLKNQTIISRSIVSTENIISRSVMNTENFLQNKIIYCIGDNNGTESI